MPGPDASTAAVERAPVVAVGSQADVACGSHREKCDSLDAQQIGRDWFELSDVASQNRVEC
jgi:hypothetical protein